MPSFASLLALTALALPLASASAHYSHPRRHHEAAPLGTVRYRSNRSLPRSGRRLSKRGGGEATLKCLSTKTFALCDGDKCTDMDAVAAGTACIDNKITWDTEHEASAQDSSAATAASVEKAEPVSASPVASSAVVEVSITQKLVNNAAVQTTTTSTPVSSKTSSSAPAPTADAGVNLNVNPSSSSSDSASDAFPDDDDDDEECDSEDTEDGNDDEECDSDEVDSSASSSSAWAAPSSSAPSQTPAASPSSSSKPSPSSAAVSSVNLIASQAAPTTTTTTQAPAPTTTTTTTTTAAAQTSSASSGGSSSGGNWIQGKATFFYQGGAAGACGKVHADSDKIVALSLNLYGSASNSAPDCGRQIEIKNEATGQSTVATVADACPGCDNEHLDLSVGAFDAIGKQEQGVVPISWKFIS